MPRGGDGAAGAEDVRDALATTKGSGAGKGGMFDSMRLKRQQPWRTDGAQRTEILAGNVDSTGKFKGLVVSDVHVQALMRYFSLAATCLPPSIPPSVQDMAGALEEGFPLVIVTRGLWGRDLDQGIGPKSNNREEIWGRARAARAENPRLLITCIDVPADMDGNDIEACLQPPLSDYRELVYSDGTWYTQGVESATNVGKQLKELLAKPVTGPAAAKGGVNFQRKKFNWREEEDFKNLWTLVWKPVLEVRPKADVPRATNLNFSDADASKAIEGPNDADVQRKKAIDKAHERAKGDDKKDAVKALESAYKLEMEGRDFSAALNTALELKALRKETNAGGGGHHVVAAVRMAMDTHLYKREPAFEEAKKLALDAKAEFKASKDKKLEQECLALAVSVPLNSYAFDEALKLAADERAACKKAGAKDMEAFALCETAKVRAANEEYDEAISAFKEARDLFKAAKEPKHELHVLQEIYHATVAKDGKPDISVAKDMLSAAQSARDKKWEAMALLLTSDCSDDETEKAQKAKEAVALFEAAGDKASAAQAQAAYATALLKGSKGLEESDAVLKEAQSAVAKYKGLGREAGQGITAALLTLVEANMNKGNYYSAMWSAKQVVTSATKHGDDHALQLGIGAVSEARASLPKDAQVGPGVPIMGTADDGSACVMFI